MTDEIQFNKEPDQDTFVLRSKKMDLEAGWLGRCFGASNNAPINIAGLIVVILVGSGVAVLFFQSAIPTGDYWKIIAPLVTLVMGFLFGRSLHSN